MKIRDMFDWFEGRRHGGHSSDANCVEDEQNG